MRNREKVPDHFVVSKTLIGSRSTHAHVYRGRGRLVAMIVGAVAIAASAGESLAISSRTLFAPTGAAASDFFGSSVGTAGDVNGDGYADVIVGANGNDAGGLNAGRAYVYYGGPAADAVADLTLTGAAAGDFFGYSISGAGDVNGDGYADVIVGAYANDAGGADAGRAYVYFGGPSADATADLTLTGAAAGDNFGISVGTAGDVNGDGYADVIVGALLNDAGGVDAGRAYVYYGGPGPDAAADLTLTGAAAGDAARLAPASAPRPGQDGHRGRRVPGPARPAGERVPAPADPGGVPSPLAGGGRPRDPGRDRAAQPARVSGGGRVGQRNGIPVRAPVTFRRAPAYALTYSHPCSA